MTPQHDGQGHPIAAPGPQTTGLPPPPPMPRTLVSSPAAITDDGLRGALTGTLQGFLWTSAALAGVLAVQAARCLVSVDRFEDAWSSGSAVGGAVAEWEDRHDGLLALSSLFLLAWLTAFILLIIWTHRAHWASQRRWTGSRRWSAGWAVGGWFVPLANLVIPRLVLAEIDRILLAACPSEVASADRRRPQGTSTGWVWWFGLCTGLVVWTMGNSLSTDPATSSAFEIRSFYALRIVAVSSWGASCVAAVRYVRLIGRLAAAAPPPAPHPWVWYPTGTTGPVLPPPVTSDRRSPAWLMPTHVSGWAVASGYLGLLFFLFGIPGPLAVYCGVKGLREIEHHPDLNGTVRCWVGIVLGALGSLLLVLSTIALLTDL